MSDAIEKRKPGRPIKDRISTRLESGVGDASLQRIRSHTTNILAVMTKEQRFAKYFQHLDDDEKLRLAKELAHEVAYFTLLRHCVSNKPAGRRGPRTKEDQSIFFTQVREKLAGAVVVLPQWKNGRASVHTLKDFCLRIATVTQTRNLLLSLRSIANAPKIGFRAE